MPPSIDQEARLYAAGVERVAGLDEAGRGAWAGPLVAAAVILPKGLIVPDVDDSKRLSANERERLFLVVTKEAQAWNVGIVEPQDIDAHGIVAANRLAMKRALRRLAYAPDHALVDGLELDLGMPSEFIVRGDQLVQSIAAASIVAKVVRDEIMRAAHAKYPEYGFDVHKGYGTERHRAMIQKYGLTDIHRVSYAPMKDYSRLETA